MVLGPWSFVLGPAGPGTRDGPGTEDYGPRTVSVIVRRTAAATSAISATSTKNTIRIEVPPRNPATNGLLAIPTSDALVSTPKPAPCAPGGMTEPAALNDAVIAAPIPRPSSTDAVNMIQKCPERPRRPAPAAASAAPPLMTIRPEYRFSSLP